MHADLDLLCISVYCTGGTAVASCTGKKDLAASRFFSCNEMQQVTPRWRLGACPCTRSSALRDASFPHVRSAWRSAIEIRSS